MTLPKGRFQGTPNPHDRRYRTDQPWPVGTIVLVYVGDPARNDNIEWLQQRYGSRELIAEVLSIQETTFVGYCPIKIVKPRRVGGPDELQWPVDGLIPEHEWLERSIDIENWLDS